MTKIGGTRIHTVRVRGGSMKYRALRLDPGEGLHHRDRFHPIPSVVRAALRCHIGKKKEDGESTTDVKKSAHVLRKLKARDAAHTLAREMEAQFIKGRLL